MLTCKDFPFIFGPEQIAAQDDLKQVLLTSPALHPLDYKSLSPVILAVDTSYIAVGFHLCQCDRDDPRKHYYARFGSITLNDREVHWWDPISPMHIMNHVWHLSDTFATIWDDSRSRTTRDDTLCDHLQGLIPFYNTLQCSLSLLRPFLTFSDAFRPFATFLDFALFNTPLVCVAFSGTFHQTLFTWLVHHSFGFSAIILVRSALRFADISRFSLLL